MTTEHPGEPRRRARRLQPWLVKKRDLLRYLGRAMDACQKGRVILFYHRYKGRKELIALFHERGHDHLCAAACLDFASGRYRKVTLAERPKLSRL